jgi:hypothetical protein
MRLNLYVIHVGWLHREAKTKPSQQVQASTTDEKRRLYGERHVSRISSMEGAKKCLHIDTVLIFHGS